MNLLFFVTPERSAVDPDDFALYQRSPVTAEAKPGESVWVFSPRGDGAYTLIRRMIVAAKAEPPGPGHEEEFRLPGDLKRTRFFDLDQQPDFANQVRRLGLDATAQVLGHSFRGRNAVRPLTERDHRSLLAYSKTLRPIRLPLSNQPPAKPSPHTFVEGREYTRREIHDMVGGGSLQHYLPHKDGQVLCGAFRRELNPDMPEIILVGRHLDRAGELLCEQGRDHPIPVFEGIAPHRWKYHGDYWVRKLVTDRDEMERYAKAAPGRKIKVMLKLERSDVASRGRRTGSGRRTAATSTDDESVREAVETTVARGQGFRSNAAINKAIEDHAMAIAEKHFADQGFRVTRKGKPYDLLCRKGREELFVEVKGTQTTGEQIILTSNEVEFARRTGGSMVLVVVSGIELGTRGKPTGGEMRVIKPWDVDGGILSPYGYNYTLPAKKRR